MDSEVVLSLALLVLSLSLEYSCERCAFKGPPSSLLTVGRGALPPCSEQVLTCREGLWTLPWDGSPSPFSPLPPEVSRLGGFGKQRDGDQEFQSRGRKAV